ncbi:hypothetical protein EVAR_76933_1 [Eumeta japonica]|uniref:Uncharacterized protein n=1 Tax=Eumeta variegata TaxID=151549 RepID=A0A4C1SEU9_EUMVA|nr:hypothetical protein EVAR_76933_1 [Eumeta japonica]
MYCVYAFPRSTLYAENSIRRAISRGLNYSRSGRRPARSHHVRRPMGARRAPGAANGGPRDAACALLIQTRDATDYGRMYEMGIANSCRFVSGDYRSVEIQMCHSFV